MKKIIMKLFVAVIMVFFVTIAFSAKKNVNLVKNGKFENWSKFKITNTNKSYTPKLLDGTVPTGWWVGQSSVNNQYKHLEGAIAPDTEITHNSKLSLKIENGLKTDLTEADQIITNIEPYTSYKISCWIKGKDIVGLNGPGQGPGVTVWFNWGPKKHFWSHQHFTGKNPQKKDGTFNWKKFSFTVDTGAGAGIANLSLQLRQAKGTMWYDDVKVVKIGKVVKSF